MDEHAVAASVGGAHRDGEGGSSDGVLESTADHENCATAGLGYGIGAHGVGDGEPSSSASRSATEPIDQNQSYMIPIMMNLDRWPLNPSDATSSTVAAAPQWQGTRMLD
jgi:hypothetical protein